MRVSIRSNPLFPATSFNFRSTFSLVLSRIDISFPPSLKNALLALWGTMLSAIAMSLSDTLPPMPFMSFMMLR